VTLPVLPGRKSRRVGDAVNEDVAVEVVALVLVRPGGQPLRLDVDFGTVPVPRLHAHVDVALDAAAQVGDRQAALLVVELLVGQRRDHRVDEDGERDRRLVGVARVVATHMDRAEAHGTEHLRRGQTGAVGVVHRLDQVVDEPLRVGRGELGARQVAAALAQHRFTELGDLQQRHRRGPRRG